MTQMYVIVASGGSYDDAWSKAEFVTSDEKLGQYYVDRMNAFRDEVEAARDTLNKWATQYRKDNPRPSTESGTLYAIPKWTGNQKITQEMRNERKRLEDLNREIRAKAMEPYNMWAAAWMSAQIEFKSTFSTEIQEGLEKNYDDTYWEIEPIGVLK